MQGVEPDADCNRRKLRSKPAISPKSTDERSKRGRRILGLAGDPAKSGGWAGELSASGFEVEVCAGPIRLAEEIQAGAALVILHREDLDPDTMDVLGPLFRGSPSRPELPIILLAPDGPNDLLSMGFSADCDILILEPPVPSETLLSAARSAIRTRLRQYRIRDLLSRVELLEEDGDSALRRVEQELRNPLAAIRTNVELMLRGSGSDDRHLDRIARQLDRLTERIDRLKKTSARPNAPVSDGANEKLEPTAAPTRAPAERASADGVSCPTESGTRDPLDVLVVEDVEDTRRALGEYLGLCGHHVDLAADGREGLAKLLESPPDVALVDIDLPEIDGYDLARIASRRVPEVGLIAVTGLGSIEDRNRALEAGFDLHLLKPFPPDELAALLADRAWKAEAAETAPPGGSTVYSPSGE